MRLLALGICTALTVLANHNPVTNLLQPIVTQEDTTNMTYEQLQQAAKLKYRAPIDAKVNKSGTANVIPELNGVEVDIDATWRLMQNRAKGAADPFVYRQIPPKVSMRDLPPMPIYQGNPEKKEMALMINVAWGTEYLDGILQVLKDQDVKATFFLDGSWLAKNRDAAKKLAAAGHEIGNHAYSHPDMARLAAFQQEQQIVKTQKEIKAALGMDSKWFAPPSGSFNDTTVKVANNQGMHTILWTLDTVDWRRPPKDVIVRRIVPRASNGAMVLMHPTEPTLQALHQMLPQLKQKGYRLVTVSELLSPERSVE